MHFLLCWLRSGHRIGARQAGNILTKGVSGDEGMKIIFFVKVIGVVVPASKVGAGCRHALALPKWLEQTVFVQMKKQLVILVELGAKGAIEELYVRVRED